MIASKERKIQIIWTISRELLPFLELGTPWAKPFSLGIFKLGHFVFLLIK